MIVITGGAGFIGSNLVEGLNEEGIYDILVVDNALDGGKLLNLSGLRFLDYIDKNDFIPSLNDNSFSKDITAIFHLGACSATTEPDGRYLMKNNYEYSKYLFNWSKNNEVQFIYASSASVYGDGKKGFSECFDNESPKNPYAFSKFCFDQYVRNNTDFRGSQVVGLRYFNVYGPRESHKASMASTAFHFRNQIIDSGVAELFGGACGYDDGEHRRDFVYVKDCVDVKKWLLKNKNVSGIFNVGTGKAETFNAMANAVISALGKGSIEYIPFPDHLRAKYQSFTKADISKLRSCGYKSEFRDVKSGVSDYVSWLNNQ